MSEDAASYLSVEQGISVYDRDLPTFEGNTASEVVFERARTNPDIRVLDLGSYGGFLRQIKVEFNERGLAPDLELTSVAEEDARNPASKEFDETNGLALEIIEVENPGWDWFYKKNIKTLE